MPALVDTTIRLLSQEPLTGRVPTGTLFELAETLDGAGFAYLEVSGGGVFDSAVRRGVESPWERIRALKARTETPLGLALRGGFLVGSRPISTDLVRRFVASAAASGIDVFRLHDPLNDVSNLRHAAEAIAEAGREFDAGLVYGSGFEGEVATLVEQARKLPELGAVRVLVHDPSGALKPHVADQLVRRIREESGLPVGLYCQGAGGNALAATLAAAQAGADRLACAVYPVALSLHRVSAEGLADTLAGLGIDTRVDVAALWRASELVDQLIGDEPVTPLAPRIAVRAAQHSLPAGLVASVDAHLRAQAAGDRIDEVLSELKRVREETGWPPLAAPVGQVLASQALIHVLSARRYEVVVDELRELLEGRYGNPPGQIDPTVRRAVELLSNGRRDEDAPPDLGELRERYRELASSEEELLLLAIFGEEAGPLLQAIRVRGRDEALVGGSVDQQRAERIRELVRIVQESGVAEIAVEEAGMRVSVRRAGEEAPTAPATAAVEPAPLGVEPALPEPMEDGLVQVTAPMVGTFYRAAEPGAKPYVEEGDVVSTGQTLCILEAMKLMNEIKADVDGIVRRIHVRNAEPVEYGQLLFDLERVQGRPLDAL